MIALAASGGWAGSADVAQARQAEAGQAGEQEPFEGRPVSQIRFEGLERVSPQFVRNQLRTQEGRPFRSSTISEDIQRLNRTGRFFRVESTVAIRRDGTVEVVFQFEEAEIIRDVQVVGNRNISDQELAGIVGLLRDTPVDEFALGRARRDIEALYRSKGYYQALVTIDEAEMAEGVVLFRIREGERTRVTEIRFRGNDSFSDREVRTAIRSRTAGIFRVGPLDDDALDQDVVAIARYYRDRGYLDVRTDREITPSPDGREAIVTFLIDEGERYTLRSVRAVNSDRDEQGRPLPLVFTPEQITALMELKTGDVYGVTVLDRSVRSVQESYWRLGYVDARVNTQELRDVDEPVVDLVLTISEGGRYRTGEIIVKGNTLTRQRVVRREMQVRPDRPLDRTALEDSRRRLNNTRLFARDTTRVTIQPPDPLEPEYRDVLVEVQETNTASLNFGAAVSSDSGLVGTVSFNQQNFDIMKPPTSWDELVSGRAFRGGGQDFSVNLSPGFQLQTYSINFTEPYLFDSDISLGTGAYYRDRRFRDHDETRIGGRLRFGRRFGDRWTAGLNFRAENVELSRIRDRAPVDLFEDAGPNNIFGAGLTLTRTTVPPAERLWPSRGARTEISAEQVFGDFTFNKLGVDHQIWLTLSEDFLGRKNILSFRGSAGYIPQSGEAPIYERFFLGGRSFRGFDFRGVSPRGIRNDTGELGGDPVGGEWLFFLGAEYLQPIWGNDNGRPIVSGVLFLDTGTVSDDIGFGEYRVSVGLGLRMLLPISPVPLAFDFGFPIKKEDGDDTRLFTFSIDVPF
ncbi:MAG: hypothetical protein EA376_04290 [Phycisphaeraceae bacterium]|nr:MAG: hypothetical protein EA376_04290 [Phycisphaeraceae bacterium]